MTDEQAHGEVCGMGAAESEMEYLRSANEHLTKENEELKAGHGKLHRRCQDLESKINSNQYYEMGRSRGYNNGWNERKELFEKELEKKIADYKCATRKELDSLRSQLALSNAREVEMREAFEFIENLHDDEELYDWNNTDLLNLAMNKAIKALSSNGSYAMERMKLLEKVCQEGRDVLKEDEDMVDYDKPCFSNLKKAIAALDALEKKEKG